MLRNNINLLERKQPTGLALPALRLGLTLFVAMVALGGFVYLLQGHGLRTVQQDLARVQAQTEHLQHAIVEVPSPELVLADRLATEEREVQTLEGVAHTLSTGGLSHTTGFVGPLQAFGRTTTEGVWLTGLTLDNRRGSMVVEGHALDASRIPALLQTLRAEPYFAGTAFAAIEMTAGVPNGPVPADRALKFRISTPTADAGLPAPGSGASAPRNQGSTS
jgi:Tfp pilus assembly protein PilN